MRTIPYIFSINGSDSTGQSGIGADIQTIAALGGHALTAITCIEDYALPSEVVLKQVEEVISTFHPKAIKVGLVTDSCRDAEKMLGISIRTDDDMLDAARRLHEMGAEWVLLRGARHIKGRLIALLYSQNKTQFFSSYNTEGWQKHGVAGALSAAITTRLGMGDDVPTAVRNAHDFIHSQVVYAKPDEMGGRSIDIYNRFVSLVAEHYRTAHDVAFYADRLCITTRYLSGVTDKVVGKSPKQIIADYIMSEAKTFLDTTRLTIQEIADRLGFSSQVLFCKFFKAQEKTSPSDYRKQQ